MQRRALKGKSLSAGVGWMSCGGERCRGVVGRAGGRAISLNGWEFSLTNGIQDSGLGTKTCVCSEPGWVVDSAGKIDAMTGGAVYSNIGENESGGP
jgi:hypothetical protein